MKLVLVGDEGVGKTCLVLTLSGVAYVEPNTVSESYGGGSGGCIHRVPRIADELMDGPLRIRLTVDADSVPVEVWDTPGGEDYARLRPLSYPQTDVYLICYDVSNPVSFENVKNRWIPEIQHHDSGVGFNAPMIFLVGCKNDREACIGCAPDAAKALCTELGLAGHAQCSAKTQTQDDLRSSVLAEAVRVHLRARRRVPTRMAMRPSHVAAAIVVAPVVAAAAAASSVRRRCVLM